MEQRWIEELIISSGQDWRGIEKVELTLHVESLVEHGVGDRRVEMGSNDVKWASIVGGVFIGGWEMKFDFFIF
jgi:hypothetical protein